MLESNVCLIALIIIKEKKQCILLVINSCLSKEYGKR